jgi:hypothetical protein
MILKSVNIKTLIALIAVEILFERTKEIASKRKELEDK